jgi:hypothetical protein
MQTLIPGGFHSRHQAAKISRRKFPWSPRRRRPPRSPCRRRVLPRASVPSLSPPRILCAIVPDHGRALCALPSSPTRAGDVVDHAGAIPKPAMSFSSQQQCCPPRAHDVVHPEPFPSQWHSRPMPSLGPQHHRPPRICDVVIPTMPQSPQCHRTRVVSEPATLSSSPSSQGYIVYFSLSF